MVFLWFSCGFPMVFNGFRMVFPWVSDGFPMVFLWFLMVFLNLLVEGLGVGGGGRDVGVTGSLVRAGGELELVGGLEVGVTGLTVGTGVVLEVEKDLEHFC